MCQCQAVDGRVTAWHKMHYAKLASSGAGLVIVEATAVCPNGRITTRCLGLYADDFVEGLAQLRNECRAIAPDVKLFIELNHAGRKGSRKDPATGRGYATAQEGGFGLCSPSALAYDDQSPIPREMTEAEILETIDAFARAAVRAKNAGYEGVQIHCAHGYLIHQFLSPVTNRRTDGWGGDAFGRMRFALEVIQAVRKAVPDMPIMLRVPSGDYVSNGWTMDDTLAFLKKAASLGVVAVDASDGGLSIEQNLPDTTVADRAKQSRLIKDETGLKVYCVGRITEALQAEAILQAEDADGVGIGREMIRNPNWGWTAAQTLHSVVQIPATYWAAF